MGDPKKHTKTKTQQTWALGFVGFFIQLLSDSTKNENTYKKYGL
ncbi:MAG: hypothetical protein ACJA0N_002667 [Pseudohongiellaceae bacterium]|jgi:hypothetical protein